jgi:hypothetical protein
MTMKARQELFAEAADRMDVLPIIMEKDFWVCWVLRELFSHPTLRKRLIFKGGTSLSKVYKIISRFSEDIDLAVDWEMLGFIGDSDPLKTRSKSKQADLNKKMIEACRSYIQNDLVNTLRQTFENRLGPPGASAPWRVDAIQNEPDTIRFYYPTQMSHGYLESAVRLELGTHSAMLPQQSATVMPFVAEQFPDLVKDAKCPVNVLSAERTFWEKATILHHEHHRPAQATLPPRYSRHYYDVAQLAASGVKSAAISDKELLRAVVDHKQRFYPRGWAQYELAVHGTFRLMPSPGHSKVLKEDYEGMKEMIYGDVPEFDELMNQIRSLEAEINAS